MALDPNTPDQIYQTFVNHGPAIQSALLAGANRLFYGLAVIEVSLAVGWAMLRHGDLLDIIALLIRQALGLGFWFWMMSNWAQFGLDIVQSFGIWGNAGVQAMGGTPNLMPMGFLVAGLDVAHHIWDSLSIAHFSSSFLLSVAGIIVVGVFGWVTSEIMLVLIESFLAAYTGTVLMAFSALGHTRDFAFSQVRYAVSVGNKRLVLQIIAGLSQTLVNGWSQQIMNTKGPMAWGDLGVIIVSSAIIAVLAYKGPKIAQDMIMGTHLSTPGGIVSSLRTMTSVMTTIAASVAGAGAAGAAGVSLASKQVNAASDAGKGPSSRAGKAAAIASQATKNVGSAVAADVGRRLSGGYSAAHGYRGWRIAADLSNQKRNLS